MNDLEKILNVNFEDDPLFVAAITHSSYANEHHTVDYERLEFLGDAVLELCISDYLYNNYPKLKEGEMTKTRAQLVREESLVYYASKINLSKFILLGNGEELSNGRIKPSIIADVFEAILGAQYEKYGFLAAKELVEQIVIPYVNDDEIVRTIIDHKSYLQELVQTTKKTLVYKEISKTGPDHDPLYKYQVLLDGYVMGEGTGRTKKEAEQQAAKQALTKISN